MAETLSITGVDVTVANFAQLLDDCYEAPKGDRKAAAAQSRLRGAGSRRAGGDTVGARVADEGIKFALIADDPTVYFTTPTSTATRRSCSGLPRSASPNSRSSRRCMAGAGAEDF